jgi:hypothetical protein
MATKRGIVRVLKRKSNRLQSVDRTRSSKGFGLDAQTCKDLASNVRRMRLKKRITLGAFARKTGRPLDFLKTFERGEFIIAAIGDAESFAEALGVNVSDLLKAPDLRKAGAVRRSRNRDRS